MIKLLIFDFDGTLFDTAPGIHTTINGMLRRRGLEEIDLKKTLSYIGGGLNELARRLWPDLHEDPSRLQEIIAEFRRDYREVFLQESYLYKGVVAILLTPLLYIAHYFIDNYLGKEYAEELSHQAAHE